MRKTVALLALLLLASGPELWAQAGGNQPIKVPPQDAQRMCYRQGRYDLVVRISHLILWDNINQPEALYLFASALESQSNKEEAAVYYSILLSVLENANELDIRMYKTLAETHLAAVNQDFEQEKTEYVRTAAGKKFTAPEAVSDLWMTQVKCTPHPLHGLYAWKLVGGRRDAKPDWIHNAQGAVHRSAAKYMSLVNERKGLLFCVPNKKSQQTSRMYTRNIGKGQVLRVGTQGYNFTYDLRVLVDDKEIFYQTIGKDAWEDLRIPLGPAAGVDVPVVLELVIPEDQRWAEGAWFDYVDFFED